MRHRARSHESAHADSPGGSGDGGRPMSHPLVCPAPAEMVTAPTELSRLLAALKAAGSFAFDTEFIGEQSYVPRLCLIQVATSDRVALIDPLAGLDVTPFWELVCDASVEKIVHAGQQDLEPTYRLLGKVAANVLDVQVACAFVRLPYPLSLSKLVGELVGAKLGKGLTFTSWDQRPLSSQQMRYAADDVRYLPAARQELRVRLEAAGHTAWAGEESALLCSESTCRFDPDENFLKIRGAGSLDPANLAVLRELAIWRDAAAREADVPPRTFLQDELILALARNPAKAVERLGRVRGLPRPVETQHGDRIVAATLAGLSRSASDMAAFQQFEPSPREKFSCDSLWASAQASLFSRGIDPGLVSSRQEIGELWRVATANGDVDALRVMRGWRRGAVGGKLLEIIRQQAAEPG